MIDLFVWAASLVALTWAGYNSGRRREFDRWKKMREVAYTANNVYEFMTKQPCACLVQGEPGEGLFGPFKLAVLEARDAGDLYGPRVPI